MRAWLVLLPVVALTLFGLPFQWLAIAFDLKAKRWIPMLYHRAVLALIGVRVRRSGEVAKTRPLLIVANHVSWLDIVVLGAQFPLCFIAKSEVGTWPGIGKLAKLQRTIFVDRQSRAATGRAANEIAGRLGDGDPVVLFAEGTSSDGNRVLTFRSALLGAASRGVGDTAIQPLAIAYVGQGGVSLGRSRRPVVAWYGDMELGPHLMEILRRGRFDVELHFGEALETTDRKAAAGAAEHQVRRMLADALNPRGERPH